MTPCPACQKPVDPLRSRFVGVLDGKIVAYCSAACAATNPGVAAAAVAKPAPAPAAAPPAPAATAAAPAPSARLTPAGIPTMIPASADSGPVIEIIREPSVPASTRDNDDDDGVDEPIELRKKPPAEQAAAGRGEEAS